MTTAPPSDTACEVQVQVHFQDSCVLIPDPIAQSRMPRLVKKSYSLPLWKKRSSSRQPSSDAELDGAIAASPSKDAGVTITVPLPSFARSRSPSREEYKHQPLVPCIIDASHHRRPMPRRPSLPDPPRPDAITVPLRPCCQECYPITEESLKEGDEWQEKFTRAARRRRNSSADAHARLHAQRHRTLCQELPGFGAIVTVDEIDRRHGISRTAATPASPNHDDSDEEPLAPSLSRLGGPSTSLPPPGVIGEEDEEEGFPLSSPNTSPHYLSHTSPSRGDTSPLLSQALADTFQLSEYLGSQSVEHGEVALRETVYYTPDTSPLFPSPNPSLCHSSPLTEKDDSAEMPQTPPLSRTAPVSIPSSSHHHKTWVPDFTLSSLDTQSGSEHQRYHFYDTQSTSTASPELTDYIPTLLSTSPRKKNILHSLPRPGVLLRASSDMFRGFSVPGTTMA
ncbi:hypothetical protein BC835DRAFT_1304118 [Cytidiella melzeri]|nr:hypothetical protein BC835DRAFT_1304118 [Cytidiella melzeri]